jgi:adenine-specific DNA-methyltransferase
MHISTSGTNVNPKEIGQFFTPSFVANFMVSLSSKDSTAEVLEPCFGAGVFINSLQLAGYTNIHGYEIDSSYSNHINNGDFHFESFVSAEIDLSFDLIIGNPPYVRWKNLNKVLKEELQDNPLWNKYLNSLSDYLNIFILRSVELLADRGELIFITPEFWMNTQHSMGTREFLLQNGYFEKIIHLNESNIFDGVTSSFIIFKFIKGNASNREPIQISKVGMAKRHSRKTLQKIFSENSFEINFEVPQFSRVESWSLIDAETGEALSRWEEAAKKSDPNLNFLDNDMYLTLGDVAEIANGMVSGLDSAFKIPPEVELTDIEESLTLDVVKGSDMSQFSYSRITKYIFAEDKFETWEQFHADCPNFANLLTPYLPKLEKRYSYGRDLKPWQWAFLRSYNRLSRDMDKIFIPCKERISSKNYIRFSIVPGNIFPTQDVTAIMIRPEIKESIYYLAAILNSKNVFEWVRHKGTVKGNVAEFSKRPLAAIPIKLINWNDKFEVAAHDELSRQAQEMIGSPSNSVRMEMEAIIESLI